MRVLLIASLLAVVALPGSAVAAEGSEIAPGAIEGAGDFSVGDTLQAIKDVSLDEAVIAEGSKVSISGRRAVAGAVVLDVALADGHVVKGLPLGEVKKSFRRVAR